MIVGVHAAECLFLRLRVANRLLAVDEVDVGTQSDEHDEQNDSGPEAAHVTTSCAATR